MWRRTARWGRIAWTVFSLCAVLAVVCAAAAWPAVAIWHGIIAWTVGYPTARVVCLSLAIVPSYALFALGLMALSAGATRMTGWRTPPNADLAIVDLEWPLLNWVRYMAAIHVVRLFAGTLFRGSPIWSTYLKLNGARLGRRVYVNSLAVSDYCLLELGDDVVIGGDAHLAAHTVEGGRVKTAPVTLGHNVTVGVGAVVGIGVTIGPDTQIGALSLVPKYTCVEGGRTYAGVPIRPMPRAPLFDGVAPAAGRDAGGPP